MILRQGNDSLKIERIEMNNDPNLTGVQELLNSSEGMIVAFVFLLSSVLLLAIIVVGILDWNKPPERVF